jgi:hypothetical protein
MRSLNELGAPDVQPSRQSSGDGDAHRRLELAKWLSDWHLVAFLGACGLLSEVTCLGLGQSPSCPSPAPSIPHADSMDVSSHSVHLGRCKSAHSCRYFAGH